MYKDLSLTELKVDKNSVKCLIDWDGRKNRFENNSLAFTSIWLRASKNAVYLSLIHVTNILKMSDTGQVSMIHCFDSDLL